MDNIVDRFRRAEFQNNRNRKAWLSREASIHHFMAENKRGLEDWVLGQFTVACNSSLRRPLVFCSQINPSHFTLASDIRCEVSNAPDYAIFNKERNFLNNVEITEWLDSDRKRDYEYKNPPVMFRHVDDDRRMADAAVEQLRNQLEKKFRKKYPPGTWLVVNINLVTTLLPELRGDRGLYAAEVSLISSLVKDSRSIQDSPITQVWILHPIRELDTVVHRVYPTIIRSSGRMPDFLSATSSC